MRKLVLFFIMGREMISCSATVFIDLWICREKRKVNMVEATPFYTRCHYFWPWHLADLQKTRKIKMLEFRQSRLGIEPLKGNQISSSMGNPDSLEFRRIQCRGAFDDKKSVYVGPSSRSISRLTENGYYLITPLIPVLGDLESLQSPVLVNRGWVPRSWRDKALDVSEDDRLSSNSSTPTRHCKNFSVAVLV
ncbi:surfeit locus protein 1-like [Primulina huaijiensis]|uniref:surfeit locus protein 1-like n=1 Tax=Primulina huaijiensis TaxID=1492673 RepID=UPI003CC76744